MFWMEDSPPSPKSLFHITKIHSLTWTPSNIWTRKIWVGGGWKILRTYWKAGVCDSIVSSVQSLSRAAWLQWPEFIKRCLTFGVWCGSKEFPNHKSLEKKIILSLFQSTCVHWYFVIFMSFSLLSKTILKMTLWVKTLEWRS